VILLGTNSVVEYILNVDDEQMCMGIKYYFYSYFTVSTPLLKTLYNNVILPFTNINTQRHITRDSSIVKLLLSVVHTYQHLNIIFHLKVDRNIYLNATIIVFFNMVECRMAVFNTIRDGLS